MDIKEFESIFREFREKESELIAVKNADYTIGGDKLWNFKTQAMIEGRKPSEVALTLLLKHFLSVVRAVRTGEYCIDWQTPSGGEGLRQHIADARNYLVLLYACLVDETKEGGNSYMEGSKK